MIMYGYLYTEILYLNIRSIVNSVINKLFYQILMRQFHGKFGVKFIYVNILQNLFYLMNGGLYLCLYNRYKSLS